MRSCLDNGASWLGKKMFGWMKHFDGEGVSNGVSQLGRGCCRCINDEKTTIDSFPQKLCSIRFFFFFNHIEGFSFSFLIFYHKCYHFSIRSSHLG